MRHRSQGQILLPAVMGVFLFATLSISYLAWALRRIQQMRLDLAADATALSAARAQAGMLNTIASTNTGVNLFLQKANLPKLKDGIGVINVSAVPAFTQWRQLLKTQVIGFKAFPAGVGQSVSRLNGARGRALYFPFPMESYLRPKNIHAAILLNHFPFVLYRHIPAAYYVRTWSPNETAAQPPHKTTWQLTRNSLRSTASARVWLDVDSQSLLHNGGFPREKERWVRGVLIQSFYPQFNARLLPQPAITPEKLRTLAAIQSEQ